MVHGRTADIAALVTPLLPNGDFEQTNKADPFHNARPRYYLANGPLTGSWEVLSRDMIVVNWNSGKPKDSLGFFAERGNRQILTGYYDGTPDSIKGWLKAASELPNAGRIVGVMYTTWADRYDDLEAFARAGWGTAAPAK